MSKNKLPLWKKIAIVLCSILITACLIATGNIKHIITYNIQGVPVSDFHISDSRIEKLHIANITGFNKDGLLNSMTEDGEKYTIGNSAWYLQDKVDFTEEHLGSLLSVLSYEDNISKSPHVGEKGQLWIFVPSEGQYDNFYNSFINDASNEVKATNDFKPYQAFTTGAKVKNNGKNIEFGEAIYIKANGRIYCFKFTNDKIFKKYRKLDKDKQKEMVIQISSKFDKRCKAIINNFDLASYPSYSKYKKLEQKQENDRFKWQFLLCGSIIILSVVIFALCLRRLGNDNRVAKRFAIYCILCFIVAIIASVIGIISGFYDEYHDHDIIECSIGFFIPSIVFCSIIGRFLTIKSNEEYETYWIIPNWVKKQFGLRKEFKKRLVAVILFYPLFTATPLPLGFVFFVLYIIPVTILYLLGYVIFWIVYGKKIDSQNALESIDNPLYCRFCGKPIEKGSSYCPHCGKKL